MSTAEPASGKVLVVDDEQDVRRIVADALSMDGHEVTTAADGEAGFELLSAGAFDLAFVDINLPGLTGFEVLKKCTEAGIETPIIIFTGRVTVANAIEATRQGAYDYLTKPFDIDALRIQARNVMERNSLYADIGRLRARARAEFEPGVQMVGQSRAMQEIYKTIGRVAKTTALVLVQGESGTGKEMIAQAIHAYSDNWQGPFVAVNCSAIPADLLESEMFGHERGAFTGATERRLGKFEQAAGGTLLLDEIADMPMALQSKLLRVLQEREFSRVGGHTVIPTNCRIIAATNQVLEKEVEAGSFRQDLYFRLKVVVVQVPALRDRTDDIPSLVEYFVQKINRDHKFKVKGVAPEALSLLLSHAWPGNVRELENVLIRAAALAPNRVLTAGDLPFSAGYGGERIRDSMSFDEVVGVKLREFIDGHGEVAPRDLYARVIELIEKPLLEEVLGRAGGNQLRAAEILGINRNTLRKKITELGIDLRHYTRGS
ncbi:MAG: sigma-54-dependent transcriptional regulator [Candidatus Binatia bacterium]